MHLDQRIHAVASRFCHQICGERIVDHGQDHQDGVGTKRPRFGHLPDIDQKILADAGQVHRRAGRDQIGVITLKAGRVGQDRQAGSSAILIGLGQDRRIKIGADQTLGWAGLLDLSDQGQFAALAVLLQPLAKTARGRGLGGRCL